MSQISGLIMLLFFAYNSVFGDGSVSSAFSSLRRTDHSGSITFIISLSWLIEKKKTKFQPKKTYHLARVAKYEPVNEPIIYADGYNDDSKMVVSFNSMIVFEKFENEKHYVIRVSEDLDEDTANIPSRFSNVDDSGELFDIVDTQSLTEY